MKKIIVILCFFLFLCSSIVFSASVCARSVFNDAFGSILVQELDLKEKIRSSIEEYLPQNTLLGNVTANVLTSILESEETASVLSQYMDVFIEDVVREEADGERFEQILKDTLQTELADRSFSSDGNLTKEQIYAVLDQIDFSSAYERFLAEVHAQMSDEQLQLLHQYLFIRSDGAYYGSLFMIVLSAVLFFIQGIQKGLRNLALSSFMVSFMIGVLWVLLSFAAGRLEEEVFGALIKTTIHPMMNICGAFFITAMLSFAAQLIYQKTAVH